jgi:hypothetical protein
MRGTAAVAAFALMLASAAAGAASDPEGIVRDIYARIKANDAYDPPHSIYTPRLAKLLADDAADAKGEVGRLDGSIWFNAQDFKFGGLSTSVRSDEFRKDREIVTAKVINFGAPETALFFFERDNGRWLLDDVRWTGKHGWTLSLLLKYGDAGEP